MMIPDYDEFNIYTTMDDVEYYVDQLLIQGFELKEEIYSMCLRHFGSDLKHLVDIFFRDED